MIVKTLAWVVGHYERDLREGYHEGRMGMQAPFMPPPPPPETPKQKREREIEEGRNAVEGKISKLGQYE